MHFFLQHSKGLYSGDDVGNRQVKISARFLKAGLLSLIELGSSLRTRSQSFCQLMSTMRGAMQKEANAARDLSIVFRIDVSKFVYYDI